MIKKIKANYVQIIEILILMVALVLPYIIDIPSFFEGYLNNYNPEPEISKFLTYYILKSNDIVISLGLLVVTLIVIHKYNKGFVMNKSNVYHNYPFIWYWFCAKVLGIKKCNLILVPIYMQFKLVVYDIFEYYPLDELDFPTVENEPECIIENKNGDLSKINLILEDTYIINSNQIPVKNKSFETIKISRNIEDSHTRHFSPKFVNAVSEEIRKLPQGCIVNIYATTNPMNTLQVARSAFRIADRGNIAHVYVYQQKCDNMREFDEKEHKIY